MIRTRLPASGAATLAAVLALSAHPATAAAPVTAANGYEYFAAPEVTTDSAALQERGRGGREGRGSGGGAVRSGGTASWNGAEGRARGSGGRAWGGGAPSAGDAGASAPRRSGGYDRGARSYDRGSGNYSAPANAGNYNRPDRAERPAYAGRPNYGGGAEVSTPAAPTASVEANNAGRAEFSGRRGGGERGSWDGNRRNEWRDGDNRGNWDGNRRNEWRGGGDGGSWDGNRRAENRGNWDGNRRNEWRGNGRDGWRGDVRNSGRGNWSDNRRDWRGDGRFGRQGAYNQGFRDGARWDRGWRDNRRFNWVGHRQANRFLFSPGRYYAPFAGHFYRPVGIGFFLDPLFFQPRFFLNDPWAFRLPPPGARFRWVRYYDDVLLVDVFTGEVVDVIQNFFW